MKLIVSISYEIEFNVEPQDIGMAVNDALALQDSIGITRTVTAADWQAEVTCNGAIIEAET